ncbi:MAG TPA: hypothetical protein VHY31_20060 [Streptosporangiaceae bacterium]|nr:hypothetical protein [Streptosporangiaceae bacterium]
MADMRGDLMRIAEHSQIYVVASAGKRARGEMRRRGGQSCLPDAAGAGEGHDPRSWPAQHRRGLLDQAGPPDEGRRRNNQLPEAEHGGRLARIAARPFESLPFAGGQVECVRQSLDRVVSGTYVQAAFLIADLPFRYARYLGQPSLAQPSPRARLLQQNAKGAGFPQHFSR